MSQACVKNAVVSGARNEVRASMKFAVLSGYIEVMSWAYMELAFPCGTL